MATQGKLAKAQLTEITWDESHQVQTVGKPFDVQFNPETLSVAYSNQKSGGDQRGGASLQFVGQGQTKLSVQLWYDVTQPLAATTGVEEGGDGAAEEGAGPVKDVRKLTEPVVNLIKPKPQGEGDERTWKAPGVRFQWGSFLFEGVLDSVSDRLEFFSEDGVPLRSQITLAMTSQEIQHRIEAVDAAGDPARRASAPARGTRPQTPARAGDSLQQMAARAGTPDAWQDIARANGIENPRRLAPGQLVDLAPPGLRRAASRPPAGSFGAPPLPS